MELPQTLAARLWPAEAGRSFAREAAFVVGGALALTFSAKAQVPFYPVPMTLQTLILLMLGAAYGPVLAAATVALYLLEGLVGFPVFAGTVAGPAYMAGPTGGFLIGFLVAAILVGRLTRSGWSRSFAGLLAAMTLGHVAIFALGFAWLALLVGAGKAWSLGVAPFYLATVLKTLLAALAIVGADRLAQPRFGGRA